MTTEIKVGDKVRIKHIIGITESMVKANTTHPYLTKDMLDVLGDKFIVEHIKYDDSGNAQLVSYEDWDWSVNWLEIVEPAKAESNIVLTHFIDSDEKTCYSTCTTIDDFDNFEIIEHSYDNNDGIIKCWDDNADDLHAVRVYLFEMR